MDKSKLNEISQKGKDLYEKGKEKVQTEVEKLKDSAQKGFNRGSAGEKK